ncbi:hypothetical protein LCGC14_2418160 [marine sediment metagenome]|uniref:Uncharacterized protein n=1 Tax=marine sediment metagenome TaxID=412755 RepID=A0A0F9E2K4_9ZZZZ
MSHKEQRKCEMIRCLSGHGPATVYCNDHAGDATYLVGICVACAEALNVLTDGTLPAPTECTALFAQARRKQHAKKERQT